MAEPARYARRSFVYRELAARGARFRKLAGSAVAFDFGDPENERRALERLGLCDLSPLQRVGFKGPAALDWLRARRVRGLDRDNRADIQRSGALVARLAPNSACMSGNTTTVAHMPMLPMMERPRLIASLSQEYALSCCDVLMPRRYGQEAPTSIANPLG